MKKTITKYAIYAIAVWSATLINGEIIAYIKPYVTQHGYLLVLIDMAIVVLIFAPAFAWVSKYTKKISAAYVKTSKKVSSTSNGHLLGILVAFVVLFLLFAYLRHHINMIHQFKVWLHSITSFS